MHRFKFTIAGAVVASLVGSAQAQELAPNRVDTIHGLQVGQACESVKELVIGLRARGYQMATSNVPCAQAQAEFSSILLLADHEERLERVDVGFAPGGLVWRVQLNVEWKSGARLFTKPTHVDLVNSLAKRFGTPSIEGSVRSVAPLGAGQWTAQQDLVWQVTAGPEAPQSRWAWGSKPLNLSGIVMEASILSQGETGEPGLVLAVANREWQGKFDSSVAAGADFERRKAQAKSASFLRGF